jgi:hypothetical protein
VTGCLVLVLAVASYGKNRAAVHVCLLLLLSRFVVVFA